MSTALNISRIFIRTVVIVIPSALIILYLINFYHQLELKEDYREIASNEMNHLLVMEAAIEKDLEVVTSDLKYLHAKFESGLLSERFGVSDISLEAQQALLMFCNEKKLYDQLRILDSTGLEQARINFNDGHGKIVPSAELQDKSKRYYFRETMEQDSNDIYVSPFDLNVENGAVEVPVKPMIRFGLPLHDRYRTIHGVVLANYLGERLLKNFEDNLAQHQGTCMLLNQEGYYLYHPDSVQCFGFMYAEHRDKTLLHQQPDVWSRVSEGVTGQYFGDAGLVTYRSIQPLSASGNTEIRWILVSQILPEKYTAISHHDEMEHIITFSVILLMTITIAILFGVISEKRYQSQRQIAESEKLHRELSAQLQESNGIKELLLDIITHDLKNPAGVIVGVTEILKEEQPENELVELVNNSAASLQKVMEHSTTLSKVSIGESIELYKMDLVPLIQNSVAELAPQLSASAIEVQTDLEDRIMVNANPIIAEIFINFLTNAIRYAADGKKLSIKAKNTQGSTCIEFMDEGKTIPEESREAVFRRGMQVKSKQKRGSGLGLAIVKRIAVLHDAEVGVKPNHPTGNTFWLKIASF